MPCANVSSIFVTDLSSYGVIGLVSIGLILYIAYAISFLRNLSLSNTNVYILLANVFLLLNLLSSIIFLIQPSASIHYICLFQTLSIQIFPFCLLLCYNIHFVHQWLRISSNYAHNRTCLISISSALIGFLACLIQTTILLIWYYNYHHYRDMNESCSNQCSRPLFFCSLAFNFFQLFLYSFQSSLRYHFYNHRKDLFALWTSLLASVVTITWISFYLFLPYRASWSFYMSSNSILAYGTIFFVYSFLGPFLFEQLFYPSSSRHVHFKEHREKSNKMTFQSLSLTKEQQRAFMAAYIKRNLTASCENLTSIIVSSSPMQTNRSIDEQISRTCHSTLSADSLCPTLDSTVSQEHPVQSSSLSPSRTTTSNSSNSNTMNSEYFLLNNSPLKQNED